MLRRNTFIFDLTGPIWWSLSRTDYENTKWFETLSNFISDCRTCGIFFWTQSPYHLFINTAYVHILAYLYSSPWWSMEQLTCQSTENLATLPNIFTMCNCEERMSRTSDSIFHSFSTLSSIKSCVIDYVLILYRLHWYVSRVARYIFFFWDDYKTLPYRVLSEYFQFYWWYYWPTDYDLLNFSCPFHPWWILKGKAIICAFDFV